MTKYPSLLSASKQTEQQWKENQESKLPRNWSAASGESEELKRITGFFFNEKIGLSEIKGKKKGRE